MAKKEKTKVCPRCGGQCGCDASDFGDRGWHPCFLCGETGVVPASYCEHLQAVPVEGSGSDGRVWHENGYDVLYQCPECKAEFYAASPMRLSQVCWD